MKLCNNVALKYEPPEISWREILQYFITLDAVFPFQNIQIPNWYFSEFQHENVFEILFSSNANW